MATSKAISWWDTLKLQWFVLLPTSLWGVVAPQRRLVPWVVRCNLAQGTQRFLAGLRQRYECSHLWTWLPWRRTLLVLDPASIDALLASNADAADPWLKKRAVSRFLPGALVISSGEAWRERRAFNVEALALGELQRRAFAGIAEAEAGA